ncbi:MAG: TlpA family protein disulfide reductase [Chitinophagaceae bacterium]|nr:MAG: TlpA family protein disulfide reductase [Chitinophagaceae bacterium]
MTKFILALYACLLVPFGMKLMAQDSTIKKPEYVLIVDKSKIVTMATVNEYGEKGMIKAMDKGLNEQDWKQLSEKFGKAIGDDPMFVVLVSLFTEEEKKERDKRAPIAPVAPAAKEDDGFLLNPGDTAAGFTVKMIDGTEVRLSDLRGKVVLLNFWATWCAPCIMEFHEVPGKILKKFDPAEVVFLPVAMGEPREVVAAGMEKLNKKGIVFTPGYDPEKKVWAAYAKAAIPKNFVIDQQGIIRFVSTGNAEGRVDEIANEIRKLLDVRK